MIGRATLRLSPIALVLALAACGGGGGTKTVTVTQTVTTTSSAPPSKGAAVYFLRDGKVGPVFRLLRGTNQSDLLAALEAGPTAAERAAGFTSDVGAGSASRTRLAQIVYTYTQFDPTASVSVGGKAYTRADFEEQTPAILVESPLPFARATGPLRLTGTANTFEATFQYELEDASGKILAKHFVTATSGNGVRGTFDVTVPFTVSAPGAGTLTVYENNAANGKRINQVSIPLALGR